MTEQEEGRPTGFEGELVRAKQKETKSITVTTRLFTCEHYKVLSTASSMWCNACAREAKGREPERIDSAGYMQSKPVAVVEFSFRADDPFDVGVSRIL